MKIKFGYQDYWLEINPSIKVIINKIKEGYTSKKEQREYEKMANYSVGIRISSTQCVLEKAIVFTSMKHLMEDLENKNPYLTLVRNPCLEDYFSKEEMRDYQEYPDIENECCDFYIEV